MTGTSRPVNVDGSEPTRAFGKGGSRIYFPAFLLLAVAVVATTLAAPRREAEMTRTGKRS